MKETKSLQPHLALFQVLKSHLHGERAWRKTKLGNKIVIEDSRNSTRGVEA